MRNISLFFIIGFLFLISACTDIEQQIIGDENAWSFSRIVYEYTEAFDVIESIDSNDVGEIYFYENGRGWWDNGSLRVKQDTILGDSFQWVLDQEEEQVMLSFDFPLIPYGNDRNFDFRVVESSNNAQLWRYSEEGSVFQPLRRDSVDTKTIWQWQLSRD